MLMELYRFALHIWEFIPKQSALTKNLTNVAHSVEAKFQLEEVAISNSTSQNQISRKGKLAWSSENTCECNLTLARTWILEW